MYFLAIPAGYKGYKLIDVESNQIYISKNIVFHEDLFSFVNDELPLDFFSCQNDSSIVHREVHVVVNEIPAVVNDSFIDGSSLLRDSFNISVNNKRAAKPPAYLQDYYCNISASDIPYPLADYMSYKQLSDEYESYISALTHLPPEPRSFAQAKKFDEWLQAMNEELLALENTQAWKICSLPPNKHAIGCK